MKSRFLRPEDTRLTISDGDWLLVRKRLTLGEEREMGRLSMKKWSVGEKAEMDPAMMGVAQVAAYLLDWSLVDPDGKPVVVRGKSIDAVARILKGLATASFEEIFSAVYEHIVAMKAEDELEKKTQSGDSEPSATYASVE